MKILDVDKFVSDNDCGQVTTTAIVDQKTNEPLKNGLFSTQIFGISPKEQSEKYGYIEFGYDVINPMVFKILILLDQKFMNIIYMTKKYKFNENTGIFDFDPDNGETGITFFKKCLNTGKINFRPTSKRRRKMQELIQQCIADKTFFINKYLVMPIQYRPMSIIDNRISYSDLNKYYMKLLQIKSGLINDMTQANTQKTLMEFYDWLKLKTGKKTGIIRNKLMGKVQHYSGRQVIVNDPDINMGEAVVPYRILIKIYEPFVLNSLLKIDNNISLIKQKENIQKIHTGQMDISEIYKRQTDMAISGKMILMKRDPSLHMGSWHQFTPIGTTEDVIHLHPAYCAPLNADFDGDQMGVFALYSDEANTEAKQKMYKHVSGYRRYNEEMFSLGKDFILGIYLLTYDPPNNNSEEIQYKDEYINNIDYIYNKTYWNFETTTFGRIWFYENFSKLYNIKFKNETIGKKQLSKILSEIKENFSDDDYQGALDKIKDIGKKYSTVINQSMPIDEFILPKELNDKLKKLKEIEDLDEYQSELQAITSEVHKYLKNKNTDVFVETDSGASKGWVQPDSLIIQKGIVTDTHDQQMITKNSLSEGLTSKEYFTSASSARKGIISRVRTTATTGYLYRQMVYALSSQVITEDDCGTTRYFEVLITDDNHKGFFGRYFLDDETQTLKMFTKDIQPRYINKTIKFRSPIHCKATNGLCKTCVGDIVTKLDSPNVGIIQQSSAGEYLSQNIMKVFHTGGKTSVVKLDVYDDIQKNIDL